MTIPSVVNCLIQSEDKRFDGLSLNDIKGKKWLETVKSFRYNPLPGGDQQDKPFTVRKESTKSGDYWYGYRKMGGRLHKKYIGKTSEINTPLLDSIGQELNTPPQPRVTNRVTEVTDDFSVTPKIENSDRLTALELQVQALQESLEALRSELLGKSESGNSEELPTVTDNELQTELGNLQAENEKLKADYAALLESSTAVINKLREEVREVRSQLAAEKTRSESAWEEMEDSEKTLAAVRSENSELVKACDELRSELADLKQKSATAGKDLPDAADLLNQLKAKRKKSKTDLADIEEILAMIEES